MKMYWILNTTFLILVLHLHSTETVCTRHKNCFACTKHRYWNLLPCYWCPLSNTCHAKLSLNNQCLRKQNIRKTDLCVSFFHGKTDYYSPSEAFLLARFSALAYSDEPKQCMGHMFLDSDYTMEKVIVRPCDDYFFDYQKQCLALVAKSDKRQEIIVAIRGTRGGKQALDQVLTVLTKHRVDFHTGGQVQQYFYNVNSKLYPDIKITVNQILSIHPDYEVKVTGHSLGGAVASLTSALLAYEGIVDSDNLFLYTYGMPRVGNKHYAEFHDKIVPNSWRVVRDGDIIAKLPKCFYKACSLFNGPYHHGTMVLYTSQSMALHSNYILCKGKDDSTSQCKRRQRYRRDVARHGDTESHNENVVQRKRRGVIGKVMDKHREYFGLRIGTHCVDHIMKY